MTILGRPLIGGRYRLTKRLGVGGMGEVWEAIDTRLDRNVALKMVAPHIIQNAPTAAELLKNETRATSALFNHPNIVATLDLVEHQSAGVQIPCLVMEHLPGLDGRSFVQQKLHQRKDHLTRNAIALYAIFRAAKGLMHAHESGLIHRDIKPGNILVGNNGTIKLADFGLAKFVEEATRTHTAKCGGTFLYYAPEQAHGHPANDQTDIYQLGCCLYEMLEGQAPFEDKGNPAAILHAKLYESEPDPTHMNGLHDDEKDSIVSLYRDMVNIIPTQRPFANIVVETLARILHRPKWRLHFVKKQIPQNVVDIIFKITRCPIDAVKNTPPIEVLSPLEYEDPEEALSEATALIMQGASSYIYLQRA